MKAHHHQIEAHLIFSNWFSLLSAPVWLFLLLLRRTLRSGIHFTAKSGRKWKWSFTWKLFIDQPGEYRAIWCIFNVSIVSNSGLTILESESITFRELDIALCAPSLDILGLFFFSFIWTVQLSTNLWCQARTVGVRMSSFPRAGWPDYLPRAMLRVASLPGSTEHPTVPSFEVRPACWSSLWTKAGWTSTKCWRKWSCTGNALLFRFN